MRAPAQRLLRGAAPWLLSAAVCLSAAPARAYSEYRDFVEKASGRSVDCSLCHTNPEGPEGVKPGQIGSLNVEEQARLNRARTAFEPGADVHSPILNDFGNSIIRAVGKQKFLAIRQHPEQLPAALPQDGDLDGDGIPDARELAEGTHPLNAAQGNPWLLFRNNLARHWSLVGAAALAAGLTLYGLANLRRYFAGRESAGSGN